MVLQMLCQQLHHQALGGTAEGSDLGQQGGAFHVLRQRFLQCFDLPANLADPREQLDLS